MDTSPENEDFREAHDYGSQAMNLFAVEVVEFLLDCPLSEEELRSCMQRRSQRLVQSAAGWRACKGLLCELKISNPEMAQALLLG